jgi:hypothetical protein
VRLTGETYRHAFCLIGYSEELVEEAEQDMLNPAAYWQVPPIDFYMDK